MLKPVSPTSVDPRLDILQKLRIVIRSAQQHSAWIEKRCGVNGAQLWIMQELHEATSLRVGELAGRLAIHQSTTSNLLDGLVKRGYVVKSRDGRDQRVVRLGLAEAGRELLERAPKPARGLLPEALIHLDDASVRHLGEGLQGLLDSIDALDDEFGLLPLPFTM